MSIDSERAPLLDIANESNRPASKPGPSEPAATTTTRNSRQVTFNPTVSSASSKPRNETARSGDAGHSPSSASLSSSPLSSTSSLSPAVNRTNRPTAGGPTKKKPDPSYGFSSGIPIPSGASIRSRIQRRQSHPTDGYGHSTTASSYPPPSKVGPQRSTRTTEKLKILPVPEQRDGEDGGDDDDDDGEDGEGGGRRRDVYTQYGKIDDPAARYDAVRLGKDDREWLPRVTAYCVAEKYRLQEMLRYLKSRSRKVRGGASPELIDECIYMPYSYGSDESRRPQQHRRGGDSRSQGGEEQQARSLPTPLMDLGPGPTAAGGWNRDSLDQNRIDLEAGLGRGDADGDRPVSNSVDHSMAPASRHGDNDHAIEDDNDDRDGHVRDGDDRRRYEIDTDVDIPEIFVFDYGAVVIWGMTKADERRFLAEMARFEVETLADEKVQVEDFNFYYTREYQARIYNDFISLQDKGNYKMKLAVSHALAQSVKTSLYEEMVEDTINESKDLPNEIAEQGKVRMTKKEIHMFIGRLFLLRINIHLQGSILDAPELMWTEPRLDPVYQAVRSYLEMDERVNLLTDRLTVVGDLLSVLKDQLAHSHDEYLEWIIIILIAAEILVALINIAVDIYADAR